MFSPYIYFEGVLSQPVRVRVADTPEVTPAIQEYAKAYLDANSGPLSQAYHSERQNADLTDGLNYDKSRRVGDAVLTLERYQGAETITVTLPPPEAPAAPAPEAPVQKIIEPIQQDFESYRAEVRGEIGPELEVAPSEPKLPEPEISAFGEPILIFTLPNLFTPQMSYMQSLLQIGTIESGNYVYDDYRVPYSVSTASFLDNSNQFTDWQSSTQLLSEYIARRSELFTQFDTFWRNFRAQFPTAPVMFVVEPEFRPTSALVAYAQHQVKYVTLGRSVFADSLYASERVPVNAGYAGFGQAGIPMLGADKVRVAEYIKHTSPIIGDYFTAELTILDGWGYSYAAPYFEPFWPTVVSTSTEWQTVIRAQQLNVPQYGTYFRYVGGTLLNPVLEVRGIDEAGAPNAPVFPPVAMMPASARNDRYVIGTVYSPGWEFGNQDVLPANIRSYIMDIQFAIYARAFANASHERADAVRKLRTTLQQKHTNIWNQVYNFDTRDALNAVWLSYGNQLDVTRNDMRGERQNHFINLDTFKHLYAQLPGTDLLYARDMPVPPQNFFVPPSYVGLMRALDERTLSVDPTGEPRVVDKWEGVNVYLIDMNLREEAMRSSWPSLSEFSVCEAWLTALGANVQRVAASRTLLGGQDGVRRRPVHSYFLTPDFDSLTQKLQSKFFKRFAGQIIARPVAPSAPPAFA